MTRKRSSPMGLEILLPVLLAFIMLPLFTQAAPLQDYTEIQQYTEGCYYNYNHYNEGDRIMTNEPCLNCTCHNKMLMCYLRVCPFTKPIGHDCIVEKREDQCCPIITCPEVPVDVAHAAPESGTELSFPEKFGCSIDSKFYLEGAQVPSNPNKPCELCYCIKNRTSCLMQECTLHIDGCTPIYNKGSCCPVRYNCDHENDVLELEDHSSTTEAATTTTTERPTTGFILSSTMTPAVSTNCIHNKEVYADGARIPGETACENCYCMRGDIVCAVQECHMPMLRDKDKLCHPMPAADGECCPSNYVCEDETTTQNIETTTLSYHVLDEVAAPAKDLHSAIPEEDLQLQTHIDEEEPATKIPPADDEKHADSASVRKPTDSENQQDVEKEYTTMYNEDAEITTVSSIVLKSDESKELVTSVPDTSENLPDSTTEKLSSSHDEDPAATTTKSQYPVGEDEKETATRTSIDTSELPETSTVSGDTSKIYTTASSTEDTPEIEELNTTASEADAKEQSVTDLPQEVEKSTESAEEIRLTAGEEDVTKVEDSFKVIESSEKESKPSEYDDSIAEATETTNKPLEYTTKSSVHIETPTEGAEKDQITGSESLLPSDEVTTEKTVASFSEEEKEESTTTTTEVKEEEPVEVEHELYDVTVTEESVDAKTPVSEGIKPDWHDLSTEKSKPESEEAEHSTEFSEDKEPALTTETSIEFVEHETITKLPVSIDDTLFTTSASEIEEEKRLPTSTLPTDIRPVSSEEESIILEQVTTTTKEEHGIITEAPAKSEDHTTHMEGTNPMFDDELGSGDDNMEVTSENLADVSTVNPALERDTTFSHEHGAKDTETVKPASSVTGKPSEENDSKESSEESADESTESEEDNKLLDLTTAKTSAPASATSLDGNVKYDDKQLETTTATYSTLAEEMASEHEKDTEAEKKPSESIDITTVATALDEKLPTVDQEEIDSTDRPELIEGTQKQESDKKEDITENPNELEDTTTHKLVGEHDQQAIAPQTDVTISEEEDEHKMSAEEEEKDSITTDSSTAITEDKVDFTTASPNAQADIREEDDAEAGVTSPSVEEGIEEKTSTTTKPFDESSISAEMPDMHLPSSIPGEGDCLVGEKTFGNNSIVPTADECEVLCKCISSIIVCEHLKCDVPENVEKCTVDESSDNKCCPTYICDAVDLPSRDNDSIVSSEEDNIDEIQHKVSPSIATTAQPNVETTVKPASSAVVSGMSIPEIEIPVVFTEEPMSHVKDEDELEIQVTKRPVPGKADEKYDVSVEAHTPTTPAVAEEFIVPQSMVPVELPKQEKYDTVTDQEISHKVPEVELQTEYTDSQEHINKEVEGPTSFIHEHVESTTITPHIYIPSDGKQEDEIQTTSNAPTTNDYQTVKPLDEEGSGDYKTEIETQTVIPTSLSANETYTSSKSSEEQVTSQIDLHSEENRKPEVQTDIDDSTEEPILSQSSHDSDKLETQTTYPTIGTEFSPTSDDITLSGETQKETQDQSTKSTYEISTDAEPQQHSSNVYNKDTITSTEATTSKKHDTDAEEGTFTFTTAPPSIYDSESETSTARQTPDEIKDIDSKFEGSTTTIASVTESFAQIDNKPSEALDEKHDKERIKPTQEEQELEVSTVGYEADDVKTAAPIEIAKDEFPEQITHDGGKEASADIPSTSTYRPETSTNIVRTDDHHAASASEKYDESDEKESTAAIEEEPSVFTTTSSPKDTKAESEKHHDFEITFETSTLNSEMIHVSTTISPDVEETKESEEEIPDKHAEGSGEQQTESEEIVTISSVEHVENKISTSVDHTVTPSVEGEELTVKPSSTLAKLKPQEDDLSTSSPQISDENTTETILSEEDLSSVKRDELEYNKPQEPSTAAPDYNIPDTHAPSKHPSLETFEESSGESLDSEEEISTESNLVHNINDFVTQRVEEDLEASGEESSGFDKTTERQHSEIDVITKLPNIDDKELDELYTDKTPIDDEKSIIKTTISSETADKNSIPSGTESPFDELHTYQQSNKGTDASVIEQELSNENTSTESEIGATVETDDENMLYVTQTPTDSEHKHDTNASYVPTSDDGLVTETVEPHKDEDTEHSTAQLEEGNELVTVKTSPFSDEVQPVTDKYPTEDTIAVDTTKSPILSENSESSTTQVLDEEKSEIPQTVESVTTKLLSDETHEESTTHLPAQEIEQNKENLPTKDVENETIKTSDVDSISTTNTPVESLDLTTIKPITENEYITDVTKLPELKQKEVISAKLPVHDEDDGKEVFSAVVTQLPVSEIQDGQGHDEIADKATNPPSSTPSGIVEIPVQSEEESTEIIAELHLFTEGSTTELLDIKEDTTDTSVETVKSEKDKPIGETTHIEKDSTDKLPSQVTDLPTKDTKFYEDSHEVTTELSIGAHVQTESTESITEQPTAVTEAEIIYERTTAIPTGSQTAFDKLPEQHTEAPALVSAVSLQEQDSELTTIKTHTVEEQSVEQTTTLPQDSHISAGIDVQENNDQDIKEESTILHMDAEVTTSKLQEAITELPTQSTEENVKETDEKEHDVQLFEDVHKLTETLPEHTTELPTKDKQTEGKEDESIDKLSKHTTEAPAKDVGTDDAHEKHEELYKETYEKSTELPVLVYGDYTTGHEIELSTEKATTEEESSKETSTEEAEDKLHASTTMHPLFGYHSTSPSAAIDSRIDDTTSHSTSSPAKNEEIFTTSMASSTTTEPITTSGPHYQPPPPIYGQPPQYGPTQYEDEYTDEDEGEVFGPGTCRYGGKLYVSAQQIPRDDPCDFCFCFRSDIICLQQSCPPPIAGCHEEPISGFCCPRYECPVSMATVLNITTSTTTTSTTLPPHFLHHSYGSNVQRNGCLINGRSYRVGEKIESTSGPCINCTCGGDGKMKCDPQACVPEPTMQQVMAVVASGRKR